MMLLPVWVDGVRGFDRKISSHPAAPWTYHVFKLVASWIPYFRGRARWSHPPWWHHREDNLKRHLRSNRKNLYFSTVRVKRWLYSSGQINFKKLRVAHDKACMLNNREGNISDSCVTFWKYNVRLFVRLKILRVIWYGWKSICMSVSSVRPWKCFYKGICFPVSTFLLLNKQPLTQLF